MRQSLVALIALLGLALAGCRTSYVARDGRINAELYNQEVDRTVVCGQDCDQLPKLLSGAAPKYPMAAWASGARGTVVLVYDITTDGTTSNLEVESSPSEELSFAAIAAVKRWRYKPATIKGNPVSFRARVALPFVR
jgi:TonB family protein